MNNPITKKDPTGNSSVLEDILEYGLKGVMDANHIHEAWDNGEELRAKYGNPNVSTVQQVGTAIDEAAKEGFDRDAKQHNVAMGGKPNSQGKYLQLWFTVEDNGVFTTPWTATMTYRISPNRWEEEACAENTQWYPGQDADVPLADKRDF
jgi:hypothetical protein